MPAYPVVVTWRALHSLLDRPILNLWGDRGGRRARYHPLQETGARSARARFAVNDYRARQGASEYRSMLNSKALLLFSMRDPSGALATLAPALENFAFEDDPAQWIQTNVNRCLFISGLSAVERRPLLPGCVTDLQLAVRRQPLTLSYSARGALNNMLAMTYVATDEGDSVRIGMALPYYEEAEGLFRALCDRDAGFCYSLGAVQTNLAHALLESRSGDRARTLARVESLLVEAQKYRTRESDANAWAITTLLLARERAERGELTGLQSLVEEAVRTTDRIVGDAGFRSDPGRRAMGAEVQGIIHSNWQGPKRSAHLERAAELIDQAELYYETTLDHEGAHRCDQETKRLKAQLASLKKRYRIDGYAETAEAVGH